MSQSQISQRFAKALYELAKDTKVVDDVFAALQNLGQLIHQVPAFAEFLHNPLLSAEERNHILTALFKNKAPDLLLKFLLFVGLKGRLDHLAGMVDSFEDLYAQAHNRLKAEIQVALPLDDKLKQNIIEHLNKTYSKEIMADWEVKPEILGGFRILIEGKLLDYSFTSQLEEYRQKVLN